MGEGKSLEQLKTRKILVIRLFNFNCDFVLQGIMFTKRGDMYMGQYKHDKRCGQGVFKQTSGT